MAEMAEYACGGGLAWLREQRKYKHHGLCRHVSVGNGLGVGIRQSKDWV